VFEHRSTHIGIERAIGSEKAAASKAAGLG